MEHIKLIIVSAFIFFILDALWIGLVANHWIVEHYQPWLRLKDGSIQPLWWAAICIYLLFGLAVSLFIIPLGQGSVFWTMLYGSLFGLICYGVFDFTCLALFKDWPLMMSLIDVAWGMVICSLTSLFTSLLI